MKNHYYIHDGEATKKVTCKLCKDKRLKEIAHALRSATGQDRHDLLEEQDKLREDYSL